MKKIVIMAGGFHPFHAGHYSLYKAAEEKFPDADVYVAATDDTKTRPFPFEIKKKLAQLAGVNPDKFVKVKSPFKPDEITSKYDPEQTVVIFVRSEKDRNEAPKPGGTKKDGSPSFFQPYTEKDLVPYSKHAYMDYLPTIEFGPGIKSATEIRDSWPKLNDKQKLAMVMSLYPATQKNKKLASVAVKMLDAGISNAAISEEKDEKDINPRDIVATPDEQEILSFVKTHYPEAPSTQAAFIKFVIHSLQHSKEDSDRQEADINKLEIAQKRIEKEMKKMQNKPKEVDEATLINDPEHGHQIVPDGGMGTWDEQSLYSGLVKRFVEMGESLKNKNYKNVYDKLYKSGFIENMLKALIQYEQFKEKQGNRPIAKGRQVDLSENAKPDMVDSLKAQLRQSKKMNNATGIFYYTQLLKDMPTAAVSYENFINSWAGEEWFKKHRSAIEAFAAEHNRRFQTTYKVEKPKALSESTDYLSEK